jgi:RNA polymerase sigma factor (sigma-70 family)
MSLAMDSAPREQGPDLAALASKIRGLAMAVARESHLADDLAQDAWVALLRRTGSGPGGLLLSGMSRTMRNLLRFRSRSETHQRDREKAVARPEHEACADLALERLELNRAILQAVHELEEPYRTTVLLRWFEELEPAEIARRTGVPVRTVHTRVSRALAMLRRKLGPKWGSRGPLAAFVAWLGRMQAPAWKGTVAMQTKTKVALAAALFGSAAVVVPVVMFWDSRAVRGHGVLAEQVVAAELPAGQRDDAEAQLPESRQAIELIDEAGLLETAPVSERTEGSPSTSLSGTRATTMLEVSAGSFLTATPDFASFEEAVSMLADNAHVDEKSVHRNVEDGSINGKFTVPGSDLVGSFKIMGDRYSINLEPSPGVPLPAPFGLRNITVSILEEQGHVKTTDNTVQYHPSIKKYPIDSIPAGVEVYVGWNFEVGSKGTIATPTSMKQTPDGTGWTIGNSQTFTSIEGQWGSTAAYELWFNKLSGFKQ